MKDKYINTFLLVLDLIIIVMLLFMILVFAGIITAWQKNGIY